MFHKVSHLVSLSLLLIVQFLSADVSSNIEPFPMSGFPPGASSSGGSGSSETSSAYLANDNINNINNGASGTTTTSTGYPWSPRQVVTKLGVVQGFIVRPPSGYEAVEVFLNLPYASSPEGSLRFMPPVSGSPWNGIRRSESPSPVCPQVLPNIRNETEALKMMPRGRLTYLRRLLPHLRNQSEDCLYLNVYVPVGAQQEEQQGNKLPVMVFVHGEDYGYGAGHPYDPTMLVSQGNIIAVTMNYRLGILGFLNADADGHFKLPFNFALLDQIAALQWVQENIEVFGGDRRRVTLMGHGKGAVCVNFLMISNAVPTGLLFHRVILSSGSALSPLTADLSKGPELARKFVRKVKCPTEPSSTMLQCLRELPLKYFLESELWNLFGPTGDGIVVKHSLPSESVILNRISHYPLIFGVVRAEFLPTLNNHDATYGLESERRRELLRQFIRKHYSFHRNEILAGAIHEYTDWEKPAQHPLNVRDETIDALADAQVVAPLTKVGDLHAASSRTKAYFYVFDYQSKNSDYQQRLGCVHGEDLFYIFGVPLYFYENEFTSSATTPSHAAHVGGDNSFPDTEQTGAHHNTKTGDMTNPAGKGSGGAGDLLQHQQQLLLRKEKWRKRNERAGGLGFFAGNFTWYEVQLSATVIQLWANFIRTGNPNGDVKPGKVAHMGPGSPGAGTSNTYQKQQQQQQQPGEPYFLSDSPALGMPPPPLLQSLSTHHAKVKVGDDSLLRDEVAAASILQHHDHAGGVTYADNRLRLSRGDNLAQEMELQQQQQQHHHQHYYHQPKPIFVEWPEYDSLDKKYLILDLRPRVRNHYRAHKLSFWLHLVPDYQKNSEGTSAVSIHHEINMFHGMMHPGQQNLSSKLSVIHPTIFASGLHDPPAVGLSTKTRHNSSSSSMDSPGSGKKRSGASSSNKGRTKGAPPSKELPDERHKQQDSAIQHVSRNGESSEEDPLESTYGFHTYSTALSVTIAIGCSLLILNILIFATFYYEREKRRQEHRRQKQMEREEFRNDEPHNGHNPDSSSPSPSQHHHPRPNIFRQQSSDRFPIPLTTTNITCGGGTASATASLKRRRDHNNGGGGGNGLSSIPHPLSPHHVPPPSSTTTVFCEHYVNSEDEMTNLEIFNDLYHHSQATSPPPCYLGDVDNHTIPRHPHPLSVFPPPPPEDMEVAAASAAAAASSSSSQLDNHHYHASEQGDMSYGGKFGGGARKHFNGSSHQEHTFIPISPAPSATNALRTTQACAPAQAGSTSSMKRKAFAGGSLTSSTNTGSSGSSSTTATTTRLPGALNEFSMSDVVMVPELKTNCANFSPQSSTTIMEHPDYFQIERIPTVEELIEAEAAAGNLVNCGSNASSTNVSITTVIVPPPPPQSPPTSIIPPAEFVGSDQESNSGHFFHNE